MTEVEKIMPPRRGFPDHEFAGRTARAQAMLAEIGLTAMLLTTEPEVRYFTGYLTQFWQSPTRPWFVIVPASGKPVAVIPAIGAECMRRTWVDDIRTWASPNPDDEGIALLADAILELAGKGSRIGLPMGPETHVRMPLADFRRLESVLAASGVGIADASGIVRSLRMLKSKAEIEKIEHVCQIVSGVFEALPGMLGAGMTDIDIFRTFKKACLDAGADDVAYLIGGAGPGGYGDIISPPCGRRTEPGDVLILDTGAIFDGYFCDFDRNYAFGSVAADVAAAHGAVFDATDAGFEAARPGATSADVFSAMQHVLAKSGALGNDVGRLGHGLGMQLTEWPSNMATDMTVLRPGMVLTLEPGMTFRPGRVMVHEENIVITEAGARYLTRRAPRTMPVIG